MITLAPVRRGEGRVRGSLAFDDLIGKYAGLGEASHRRRPLPRIRPSATFSRKGRRVTFVSA